ncbi:nucleoside recognition domain-containing protein [Salicibibacter kimchii]|uniref:Spore maturation protein n=1 Tax=Salicibibacter kimchii TaxID=2099786 RepID=A0A345BV63_9BACI|nr:nucleoside recognition domain-containing protein [Salicibibacter kimchii]AXF54844.1 spore maturation protein [Salicibibacter kimchii]
MINWIWMTMLITGLVFAMFTGRMEEVNEAIFEGAEEAVVLCFGLISILVFWLGMMRIAQEGGLLTLLSKVMSPIIRRLFPEVPKDHPAMGYILSNMTANMFGLGNAATPMGIKAMEQLKELNGGKDEASRSMITFLAINTASLTLIPTTVIAIRMTYDSENPGEIIGTTIAATAVAVISAIIIDRIFHWRRMQRARAK